VLNDKIEKKKAIAREATMNKQDLAFTPALEQAQLIRTKQLSPLELTQLYLDRIETLDPKLGSYFTVTSELALADAQAKTEQLATTDPDTLPPFFGIPISIKDLTAVADMPCSYGVAALRDKLPSHDRAVVTRIKQGGFVLLGKTATSQLGSLPFTEPAGFPPTRNPWNLDYSPGGSSGGASAALSAGLCAIAQASDGGGSLRGPAACCGLVGIKPARGRVSLAPLGDCVNGLLTHGAITRTVADAAAMLDLISGYVPGDPYWLPDPEPSFLAHATAKTVKPLRIAFATKIDPIGEAAPSGQQAVLDTVQHLEEMGHAIEQISLDLTDLLQPLTAIWVSGVSFSGMPKEILQPINQWFLERGQQVTSGQYLQAVAQMQMFSRRIVASLEQYDALVLPVFMSPTIRVGEWANLSPEEILHKSFEWVAPCPLFNATGQPAIVIPAGFSAGLPVGVQLVGRPAGEAPLFTLAAQLEAAHPWIQYRPPIA
jgi:amidase